jgi:hypothetical protein
MISGRNCRHLNRAGVDIGGQGGKVKPAYFTIDWFLRHNLCEKPQASFCEGEAHNDARLNLVALLKPKGEKDGEYKASLNIKGGLPTRLAEPSTKSSQ